MIRIIRTRTLAALHADRDQALARIETIRDERPAPSDCPATDFLIRAETTIEVLHKQLAEARADTARAEGERDALRAQQLLDTEDRACLRMLLRTARKQTRTDRVHVLFRRGVLHSVHATPEAAEAAAEAEGAPPNGWTAAAPGASQPPASEVAWRIQALPLGGTPA